MSLHEEMHTIGHLAHRAARGLAVATTDVKNAMLHAMADGIDAARATILEVNALDCEAGATAGLSPAMLDRLRLDDTRIGAMARGVRDVAALPDPVGTAIDRRTLASGLELVKRRVPIGVIGIIYESRPNVTADAAALCLKSGNAVILRGGSEAFASNTAIHEAMTASGVPEGAIQLVGTTDRAAVRELCRLDEFVHLVIPRGGEGLIRAVVDMATVPVLKHADGVCHVYVDAAADLDMAMRICENAKCQRPAVCNAMETMLVHTGVAAQFLPEMARRLASRGVELRGCERSRKLVPSMNATTEEDWPTEYLDLVLAVRVVDDVDAAIDHIARWGSGHSDAIVSNDPDAQARFVAAVDSAAVYVNASTRFTDGAQFGLGAEIGISTDRLHARGPMGLEELTTYKYVLTGQGQIVE